ncbi:cytochrome C [bacterium]|nr:MAG: cytochrome C [bacterium]
MMWLAILLAAFLLIQLIPYGRSHNNPAVISEPQWQDATTKDLVTRACYDCHSNESVWPWYSNVAPVSWLIQHDVDEGRQKLNFSEWGTRKMEVDEIIEVVREGEMPPLQFTIIHADARLSDTEKEQLISGLTASLAVH